MTDGPYHSIGEVLSLLKEEHEDLTISKIRFLESQGLIEPSEPRRAIAGSTTPTSIDSAGSSPNSGTTSCPSR